MSLNGPMVMGTRMLAWCSCLANDRDAPLSSICGHALSTNRLKEIFPLGVRRQVQPEVAAFAKPRLDFYQPPQGKLLIKMLPDTMREE